MKYVFPQCGIKLHVALLHLSPQASCHEALEQVGKDRGTKRKREKYYGGAQTVESNDNYANAIHYSVRHS